MTTFRDIMADADALLAARTPVYLRSAPGIGKSAFVRALAERRGLGFWTFDASCIDPAEPPGFVAPARSASGEPIATYLRSALMPTEEYLAAHPRGILFIDEHAATVPAQRHALDAVIHEQRFGSRVLPDGWVVWLAGNRVQDRSGAQRLEAKTQNRVLDVAVDWNPEHWAEDYAIPAGVDPVCIAFATNNQKVFADSVPAEQGPYCTPRSFTRWAELYATLQPERRKTAYHLCSGFIGAGAATEFMSYADSAAEIPTPDEIRSDPERAKLPSRLDLAYAAQIAACQAALTKGAAACWAYIERLPKELRLPAATRLVRTNPGIIGQIPALVTYLTKHAPELMKIQGAKV